MLNDSRFWDAVAALLVSLSMISVAIEVCR